jgi:LemA protein
MIWLIVVIVLAVVLIGIVIGLYNRLVRLRNRAENAWAQVDVQLRRRYDLIPNLVEAVKGYAAHERQTFEEVTKARTAAQQAQGVQEQAQAENMLTQAIGRLFAVAEAYPELRATENFQQLQAQLADTEQKIAIARQVYNDAVLTYDNALETVPTNIVGGVFNFEDCRPRDDGPARAPRGRRGGGEIPLPACGRRPRHGRARRDARDRGAAHVLLRRLVHGRLPRHPAS